MLYKAINFVFCFYNFPIEFRNTSYGVVLHLILFTIYFIIIIIIIIIILAFKIHFCQFLFLGKPCIIGDYEIKGRFTVAHLMYICIINGPREWNIILK